MGRGSGVGERRARRHRRTFVEPFAAGLRARRFHVAAMPKLQRSSNTSVGATFF